MGLTERLAEIDRELASFGKADDVIEDVVQRARAESPGSLEAIDAVLEGLGETRELAAPPTRAAAPSSRPAEGARAGVETVAPPGAVAKPGTWDRPERLEPPPDDASGMVEVPEELIRREALPPVLDLDTADASPAPAEAPPDTATPDTATPDTTPPAAASVRPSAPPDAYEDATDVRDPNSLENAVLLSSDEVAADEPTGEVSIPTRDERGDEQRLSGLFDDAPVPSLAPPESSGGLADLFDDPRPEPEPGAHQDLSDLLGADLQEALAASPDDGARPLDAGIDGEDEAEHTALFTAEDAQAIRSSLPPRSPHEERAAAGLDAALDAIVDEPLSPAVELSDMPPSGEFELMIDEDVLVLDADESDGDLTGGSDDARPPRSQMPPPPPSQTPPPPPSQPPPKGLMSRLLNRK